MTENNAEIKMMDKVQNSHIEDVIHLQGPNQNIYLKQETN